VQAVQGLIQGADSNPNARHVFVACALLLLAQFPLCLHGSDETLRGVVPRLLEWLQHSDEVCVCLCV